MVTQFYGKTKICYGPNALEALEHLPAKKAFIVTDAFMVTSGFTSQIISLLDRGGTAHGIFDGVEPDPSLETVTRGTLLFLRSQSDILIALGGGSVIDAAKAISFFACKATEGGTKAPLVAIPTTSGTGSEVTAISVITDKRNEVKIPLNDEMLIPDVAILDARFTRTVPPPITAATGMDVLTHAVEAYTSRQANAFTNIYAEHAIRYAHTYLPRAYRCMDDMKARDMLLLASCMAGMAFNNSGLGITHSIAHSLGGLFHIPHGVANAVMLPHVIRYNCFDVGAKYREIAEIMGLPASSIQEGSSGLISEVKNLNASMGLPSGIRELKVEEAEFRAHLDTMAANAMDDMCTSGNPRKPSHADIRQILEEAW